MKTGNIKWLENYYLGLCDGDWEHSFGCEISTLDNPGWSFRFDLAGAIPTDIEFVKVQKERSENDWIKCWVEANTFYGAGGPQNLDEVIGVFRTMVETHLH